MDRLTAVLLSTDMNMEGDLSTFSVSKTAWQGTQPQGPPWQETQSQHLSSSAQPSPAMHGQGGEEDIGRLPYEVAEAAGEPESRCWTPVTQPEGRGCWRQRRSSFDFRVCPSDLLLVGQCQTEVCLGNDDDEVDWLGQCGSNIYAGEAEKGRFKNCGTITPTTVTQAQSVTGSVLERDWEADVRTRCWSMRTTPLPQLVRTRSPCSISPSPSLRACSPLLHSPAPDPLPAATPFYPTAVSWSRYPGCVYPVSPSVGLPRAATPLRSRNSSGASISSEQGHEPSVSSEQGHEPSATSVSTLSVPPYCLSSSSSLSSLLSLFQRQGQTLAAQTSLTHDDLPEVTQSSLCGLADVSAVSAGETVESVQVGDVACRMFEAGGWHGAESTDSPVSAEVSQGTTTYNYPLTSRVFNNFDDVDGDLVLAYEQHQLQEQQLETFQDLEILLAGRDATESARGKLAALTEAAATTTATSATAAAIASSKTVADPASSSSSSSSSTAVVVLAAEEDGSPYCLVLGSDGLWYRKSRLDPADGGDGGVTPPDEGVGGGNSLRGQCQTSAPVGPGKPTATATSSSVIAGPSSQGDPLHRSGGKPEQSPRKRKRPASRSVPCAEAPGEPEPVLGRGQLDGDSEALLRETSREVTKIYLQEKLLTKLRAEGKPVPDFSQNHSAPTAAGELTEEEKIKVARKKETNKMAARKSRLKKKMAKQRLEKEHGALLTQMAELKGRVAALQRLRDKVVTHLLEDRQVLQGSEKAIDFYVGACSTSGDT